MNPRYLIILFMVLLVCSLLIEDVQPKAVSKKLQRNKRVVPMKSIVKAGRVALTLVSEVLGVITGFDGLINLFTRNDDDEKFREATTKKLDELISMCKKIDVLSFQIANVEQTIIKSTNLIIVENALQIDKSDLSILKQKMNLIQNEFERFMNHLGKFRQYKKEDRDRAMRSFIDNNNLKTSLDDIVLATKPPAHAGDIGSKNIFAMAISCLEKERRDHHICDDIPSYDKLFMFYETVLRTVIQGYFMLIVSESYFINSTGESYFRSQRNIQKNKLISTSISITETAQMYLREIDNTKYKGSYACDPSEWIEGKNFIRVKNYVGHHDMAFGSPKYTGNGSLLDCELLTIYERQYKWSNPVQARVCNEPFKKGFNPKDNPLNGTIDTYLSTNYHFEIELNHNRFVRASCYDHIFFSNQFDRYCDADTASIPMISIRKLSVRLQQCNKELNEIVTNVRFQEFDGIIRVEIECGVFINGNFDPNSRRWKDEGKDIKYDDYKMYDYVVFQHPMTKFYLDDVEVMNGEFVTGVGFGISGDTIHLMVKGTKMYDSNNVPKYATFSKWYRPRINHEERIELDIHNLPVVVNQTKETHEESQSGKHFISILASDNQQGFRGNLPITPFFNMQIYKPPILAPLGGLGLIHKSIPGYAGLLSFKFISSPFTHHIDANQIEELAKKLENSTDALQSAIHGE